MILVMDNGNGSFSINYYPERLNKTEEELLQMGVILESEPIPKVIPGKDAVLKFDGTSLHYEYVDIPPSQEEELVQVKERLKATEDMVLQLLMEGMM